MTARKLFSGPLIEAFLTKLQQQRNQSDMVSQYHSQDGRSRPSHQSTPACLARLRSFGIC